MTDTDDDLVRRIHGAHIHANRDDDCLLCEAADRIAELEAENALLLRRSKASAYLRMDSRD